MLVFKQIPDELDTFDGSLVVAVVGEDEKPLQASNSWLDWRLYGTLSDLVNRGHFKAALGEKCLLPTYGKFKFDRLVLLGGGTLFDASGSPVGDEGSDRWAQIARSILQTISSLQVKKVGLSLPRYELAEHERAMLKILQAARLPVDTSLFVSRAIPTVSPMGL